MKNGNKHDELTPFTFTGIEHITFNKEGFSGRDFYGKHFDISWEDTIDFYTKDKAHITGTFENIETYIYEDGDTLIYINVKYKNEFGMDTIQSFKIGNIKEWEILN